MKIRYFILASAMLLGGMAAHAAGTFQLDSGNGRAVLDTETAALIQLETAQGTIPFKTIDGIWSLTFADGKKLQ